MITEAAHKLLSSNVTGDSLRQLWNWAPVFDLCRHEDILVRWRAVGIVSYLLGLDQLDRRNLLAAAGASEYSATDCSAVTSAVGKPALTGARIRGSASPPSARRNVEDGDRKKSDEEILLEAKLDLAEELQGARSSFLRRNLNFDDSAVHTPSPRSSTEHDDAGSTQDAETLCNTPLAAAAGASPSAPMDVSYDHHPAVADIGGILHPITMTVDQAVSAASGHDRQLGGVVGASPFVPTPSARRNLASLSLAMTVARPILLHGPAGSGKSLLAREAARLAAGGGRSAASAFSMLELHLDDQTDSKSLLGAHACTDVPGEFAWRPGALTRAAVAGTWVLIEDVDRAPFEVGASTPFLAFAWFWMYRVRWQGIRAGCARFVERNVVDIVV